MTANHTSLVAKGIIIVLGAVASVYVGINYWRAWQGPPMIKESADNCLRCHNDPATLKAMKEKAGSSEKARYDVVHATFKQSPGRP